MRNCSRLQSLVKSELEMFEAKQIQERITEWEDLRAEMVLV